MTEEKKQAIMNCETFDDLLDQEYGPQGTPSSAVWLALPSRNLQTR